MCNFIDSQIASNMLQIKLTLLTSFLIFFFNLSEAQTPNQAKSILTDKAKYKTDTTINNVIIGGTEFSITVLRDKYDEHLKMFSEEPQTPDEYEFSQSPITVVITKSVDNHPLYIKRFDHEPDDYPYLNYTFYKGQQQRLNKSGKLYFRISKGYGGSGSQCATYFIDFSRGQINLSTLFTSSCELYYDVYSQNDKEILMLEGIWGTDESHFENHRYTITKYTYEDGQFHKNEIGQTKLKYSSLDENKSISQILTEIKTREPSLLSNIVLSNFNIKGSGDGSLQTNTPDANSLPIFYLGNDLNPDTKKFKLIGISSETNVYSYKYLGLLAGKYYYGRQIGDIIVGIKNGKIVTTIYNLIPNKDDVGVPSEIVELIQKVLPFPLAYKDGIYGVNIDNESISISRTNNPMTFNKDRIMFLTSVKQSILRQ